MPFYRFDREDGWAIASHIALSILLSVFPLLIVVTAIAAFIGSVKLAGEVARQGPIQGFGHARRDVGRSMFARLAGHGALRRWPHREPALAIEP
jgi:hypothetical protein